MPKRDVAGRMSRAHGRPASAPPDLVLAIEGQIAEICRDLTVEAKRMRQLQEQADELRRLIRRWTRQSGVGRVTRRSVMENDTEK